MFFVVLLDWLAFSKEDGLYGPKVYRGCTDIKELLFYGKRNWRLRAVTHFVPNHLTLESSFKLSQDYDQAHIQPLHYSASQNRRFNFMSVFNYSKSSYFQQWHYIVPFNDYLHDFDKDNHLCRWYIHRWKFSVNTSVQFICIHSHWVVSWIGRGHIIALLTE